MAKKLLLGIVAVFGIGFAAWVIAGQTFLSLPEGNGKAGLAMPSEEEVRLARLEQEQHRTKKGGSCCGEGSGCESNVAKVVEKKSGCGKGGACCCAAQAKPCNCSGDAPVAVTPEGRGPVPAGLSTLGLLSTPGQGPLVATTVLFARMARPPAAQAKSN